MSDTPGAAVVAGGRAAVRRPYLVAFLIVLAWNLLVVAVPLVWAIVSTATSGPTTGEDWSGVVVAILVVLGGATLFVSVGCGAAAAAVMMSRTTRGAEPGSAPETSRGKIIGIGSGAAAVGLAIAIVLVLGVLAVMRS